MSEQTVDVSRRRATPIGMAGPGRRIHRVIPRFGSRTPGGSWIITAEQLARIQPVFEQYVGIIIVLAGMVGSVMAFNGAWSTPFAWAMLGVGVASCTVKLHARWRSGVKLFVITGAWLGLLLANDHMGWVKLWAFLAGTGGQALLTLVQWVYCRNRRSWQYRLSVALDAGLSVRGYGMVLLAPLVGLFTVIPWAMGQLVAAWLILGLFAVAVAVAGERILVRRKTT